MKLSRAEVEAYRGRERYGLFATPSRHGRGSTVSSFAKPKFAWARIAKAGRVHAVKTVIFRWNHMGGTWERPYVTIHTACHYSGEWWQVVSNPAKGDLCLRCVGHVIGGLE